MLRTPVLFTIFNRPQTTREVFLSIRKARPEKLYIAADGPRSDHPSDKDLCSQTRQIAGFVDWKCQLNTNFSIRNLGCRNRMISAIDWFFKYETEGIILEDDCLPHPDFLHFAEALLKKYRNTDQIMHIGGNNFQDRRVSDDSYYFSKYAHVWGWATWRRAWQKLDKKMLGLDEFISSGKLRRLSCNYLEYRYWKIIFTAAKAGGIPAWSYNWIYTIWKLGGICICPQQNLVKNLGFSSTATNTHNLNSPLARLTLNSLSFPLQHPSDLNVNVPADIYTWNTVYRVPWSVIVRQLPRAISLTLMKKLSPHA